MRGHADNATIAQKKRVSERQNEKCAECGRMLDTDAVIHHVIPIQAKELVSPESRAFIESEDNMVAMCRAAYDEDASLLDPNKGCHYASHAGGQYGCGAVRVVEDFPYAFPDSTRHAEVVSQSTSVWDEIERANRADLKTARQEIAHEYRNQLDIEQRSMGSAPSGPEMESSAKPNV